MGKATIVEAIGAGLYKAVPQWGLTPIELELLGLKDQRDKYFGILNKALDQKRLMKDDVAIAGAAMDAVIDQWKQALIDKLKPLEPLEPPTGNDPETGGPWIDPDRAQDQPLLDALNAARVAAGKSAVSRNADLDRAMLGYLRSQWAGRIGHLDQAGRGPGFRAHSAGYGHTKIGELLNYGSSIPGNVVDGWNRGNDTRLTLTDEEFVDGGVAYVYSENHYSGHLWGVLLAVPGPPPATVTVTQETPDPATQAAVDAEAELQKVKIPKLDDLSPEQLSKAIQAYGIAVAKLRGAEREIARLQAENLVRERRIAVLEDLKEKAETVFDVWCIGYDESLAVGSVVDSMEVPGFWKEPGIAKTSVLYKGTSGEKTVSWIERSWNLAIDGTLGEATGRLAFAEGLTDAAVFVNIALEPGHLKWVPRWRYATITAKTSSTVDLDFSEETAHPVSGESPLSLQRFYHYDGVPVRYKCGIDVFDVGVEVFVLFEGESRNQPVVIGFRREPETCSAWSRNSWNSI